MNKDEVTLRTLEMLMEYEPGSYIAKISPTPDSSSRQIPGSDRILARVSAS